MPLPLVASGIHAVSFHTADRPVAPVSAGPLEKRTRRGRERARPRLVRVHYDVGVPAASPIGTGGPTKTTSTTVGSSPSLRISPLAFGGKSTASPAPTVTSCPAA